MRNCINKAEQDLKNILANEKTKYRGNIYHYTSADGLRSIIQSRKLWFSSAKFLNDYSENNYIFTLLPKFPDKYNEAIIDENFF